MPSQPQTSSHSLHPTHVCTYTSTRPRYFAVFSAEWFARQMGFRVVVIVRHPLAVVSSRKRLGWRFDLDELLAQPLLLRDWLTPIETSWPEALRQWYPRNTSGCPT